MCKTVYQSDALHLSNFITFSVILTMQAVPLRRTLVSSPPSEYISQLSGRFLFDHLCYNKLFIGFWQPRKAGLNKITGK